MACWRWSNFLEASSGGKPILHINLDESSLKMHIPARPGLVVEPCSKRRRQLLQEGQGPSLQTRRSAVTLLAMICDDPAVQPRLPQLVIANERLMSSSDFEKVAGRCQGNVVMVRRTSSWVTSSYMVEVVKMLAGYIQPEVKSRHVILHLDTCPAHTHRDVLKECASSGLHVHFVPLLTTAYLQPLDVLAFSKLKGWAAREIEVQRVQSPTGLLERSEVLDIYRRAVQAIISHGNWCKAFDMCGLRGQAGLSKRLMARLRVSEAPVVGSQLPSLQDLIVSFPAGVTVPIEELFELVVKQSTARPTVTLRLPASARLPRAVE